MVRLYPHCPRRIAEAQAWVRTLSVVGTRPAQPTIASRGVCPPRRVISPGRPRYRTCERSVPP